MLLLAGLRPSEYSQNVWYGIIRIVRLLDGVKGLRICLLISIQYTNVTDGWTENNRRIQRMTA